MTLRRGKRRSKYALRERDTDYMRWVKTLPCCARDLGPCEGDVEADHAGERPVGRKAADNTCIALCQYHHAARGSFSGPFKGWDGWQMRHWLDGNIALTQSQHERQQLPTTIPF